MSQYSKIEVHYDKPIVEGERQFQGKKTIVETQKNNFDEMKTIASKFCFLSCIVVPNFFFTLCYATLFFITNIFSELKNSGKLIFVSAVLFEFGCLLLLFRLDSKHKSFCRNLTEYFKKNELLLLIRVFLFIIVVIGFLFRFDVHSMLPKFVVCGHFDDSDH
ncbi:hypothetical protein EDEG_01362 [Edhazardia aedis USNM 41457]|uniref:Transmembrane protein n=1 Tax=Edhazardia aedis (strain USNM 41457) TaxID=1003232 RepID=J8ZXI4_EDHAE|nr:hypothetical protein EDEG_01362 [Edhazardia aedis USNM 41457]|eukprot:EJW04398.1 hypothetical protein EDEG_01362 [Edhazardia aedis USNM 41457]